MLDLLPDELVLGLLANLPLSSLLRIKSCSTRLNAFIIENAKSFLLQDQLTIRLDCDFRGYPTLFIEVRAVEKKCRIEILHKRQADLSRKRFPYDWPDARHPLFRINSTTAVFKKRNHDFVVEMNDDEKELEDATDVIESVIGLFFHKFTFELVIVWARHVSKEAFEFIHEVLRIVRANTIHFEALSVVVNEPIHSQHILSLLASYPTQRLSFSSNGCHLDADFFRSPSITALNRFRCSLYPGRDGAVSVMDIDDEALYAWNPNVFRINTRNFTKISLAGVSSWVKRRLVEKATVGDSLYLSLTVTMDKVEELLNEFGEITKNTYGGIECRFPCANHLNICFACASNDQEEDANWLSVSVQENSQQVEQLS